MIRDVLLARHMKLKDLAQATNLELNKELSGHSSVATTLQFYNQLDVMHRKQASDVIQQMLEKEKQMKL